jgi:hypothetical protein
VSVIWGEDMRPRRKGRPIQTWDSPAAVIAAVIWLVIVCWLGPRALDIEAAHEQADTAAHVAAIKGR